MIIDRKKIVVFLGVLLLMVVGITTLAGGQNSEEPLEVTNDEIGSDTEQLNNTSGDFDVTGIISEKDKTGPDQFFAEYRMERERLRSREVEMLNEIINNPGSEEKARQAASLRLVEISQDMEKEMQAESMVKSKGIADCVVIMQPEAVTVVIKSGNLPLDQERDIQQMVSKVTQINSEQISIVLRQPEE